MKQLDDTELFIRIQADDRYAFSELVNRYSDILFRFIQRRVSCTEDSEDILQEVFVSLWNQRLNITIEYSLYPYLFKAAKYKIIDWTINEQKKLSVPKNYWQAFKGCPPHPKRSLWQKN